MPDRRRRPDDDFEDEDDRPRRRRDDDEPRPRRRARARDEDDDDAPRPSGQRLSPDRLRAIAIRQKILILCIAAYLVAVVAQFFVPPEMRWTVAIPGMAVVLAATLFVFLLAIQVHGTGLGVLFGFLTLVPCVGLIVLLIVNQQATSLLQKNRVRVGLFGANMADIR